MVKNVGPAGLERIELKRLMERVGRLFSVLQEAAQEQFGEKKKRNSRQRIVSHLCSERSYGNFNRVVPVRWTISVKDATAELVNGMLLIDLPKIKDRRGSEFRVPITEIESK